MHNHRVFSLSRGLLALTLLALTGCNLEIRVPQGGTVRSTDGAYVCEAGQTCVISVVDFFFDQTFVAEPAMGYYFSSWRDKDGYLCAGETGPCRLATAGYEGNPEVQAFLESDQTFSLEPRFVLILQCPEPEIVISPAMPGD